MAKFLSRLLCAFIAIAGVIATPATAQIGPSTNGPFYQPNWYKGYVPTAMEWAILWSNKIDYYPNGLPIQYGGCGSTTVAGCLANLGIPGTVGTVTSVALSLPSIFTVTGSPVTSSGTLTGTLATQTAHAVWAGPTSGSGAPTFRALVGADLPVPSATTLGGIESIASLSNNWVSYIDTSGVPHQSQPAFSNLSGNYTLAQGPTIGANTVLGETASGTPIALAVGSCGGATNALTWTSGTGFGCNTINGAVTSVFGRTGTVVAATNDYSFSQLAGNYTLAQGPTIGANTILGETASGTPLALAIGSCSGATNALTWTSGTGFGCNTLSGSGTVNSGTANDLAYYASTGPAVSQLATVASSVLTSNGSGALTWGTALPAGITATTQSLGTNNTTLATSAALYSNGWTRCGPDVNASNQPYVTFSGLSAAKSIRIDFDLYPATSGQQIEAQFSQSGSFVTSNNYSHASLFGGTIGGAANGSGAANASYWLLSEAVAYSVAANSAAAGVGGTIEIPNTQSAVSTHGVGQTISYSSDGNLYVNPTGVFMTIAGGIDGIRLYFGSGNVLTGHASAQCLF